MPQRRTHDVVQVVMTDHFIRHRPGGGELLAPREEEDPVLLDVELLDPKRAPKGDHGEIYRTVAVLRAGGTAAAVERLGRLLETTRPPELEPYLDLALGQIQQHREAAAEQTLLEILKKAPGHLLRRPVARRRVVQPE